MLFFNIVKYTIGVLCGIYVFRVLYRMCKYEDMMLEKQIKEEKLMEEAKLRRMESEKELDEAA